MKIAIIYITLFLPLISVSQNKKDIEAYENKYQECLDKGINMLGCTQLFYKQSDSLLNVVYKKIYSRLDSKRKAKLKSSQLIWLKKRDAEFKNFEAEKSDPSLGVEDNKMVVLDKKAIYVLDRVYFLIGYK